MQYKFTILCMFLASLCSAQNNDWIKKESFGGGKRERAVGFAIGNKGYIATGQDSSNLMNKDLWEYDPVDNIWTQKADFPGLARRNAVGFALNNKGYITLGITHENAFSGIKQSDMWEYNPLTNTWVQRAPFPGNNNNGAYYATAFTLNNIAYICGGKFGPSLYSDQLWSYNPATNQWAYVSKIPGTKQERYGLVGIGLNGKAYIGLGANEDFYQNDWWEFDPQTLVWTKKADFPGTARMGSSIFALNDRIYVALGMDGGYRDDCFEYNPATNKWFVKDYFPGDGRRNAVAFSINGFGYLGTGKGTTGTRRSFYQYWPGYPNDIDEESDKPISLSVFPNPVIHDCTIRLENTQVDEYVFSVFDMQGKLYVSEIFTGNTFTFTKNNIPSGMYFIKVRKTSDAENTFQSSQKIIIL